MKAMTYEGVDIELFKQCSIHKVNDWIFFGLTSTPMESILSSLSKVSISKSFFMLFHYFILNHVLNVFIQVRNGRVLKKRFRIWCYWQWRWEWLTWSWQTWQNIQIFPSSSAKFKTFKNHVSSLKKYGIWNKDP